MALIENFHLQLQLYSRRRKTCLYVSYAGSNYINIIFTIKIVGLSMRFWRCTFTNVKSLSWTHIRQCKFSIILFTRISKSVRFNPGPIASHSRTQDTPVSLGLSVDVSCQRPRLVRLSSPRVLRLIYESVLFLVLLYFPGLSLFPNDGRGSNDYSHRKCISSNWSFDR